MNPSFGQKELLIAPCGMNCGICIAHMRDKNKCFGCNSESGYKASSCINCIIKNCEHIKSSESGFCYDCEKYPCKRLKQLDKRYRTKYRMSMIENLDTIRKFGMAEFLKSENEKWKCTNCGARVSAHRNNCLSCGGSIV